MVDIVKRAQLLETKKMVVAVADDEHVLEAVHMAQKDDIIQAILVGDAPAIIKLMHQLKMNSEDYEIIDIPEQEILENTNIEGSFYQVIKNSLSLF